MPQPIAFVDYAPDADPTTPGVITVCQAIVPTIRGYKGAPTQNDIGAAALASACYGATLVTLTDDTTKLYAGTASTMAELESGSWTDRTGATLNGLGGTDRWCFAQFGDATIAAAGTEIIRFRDDATVFAACTSTAPKCGVVISVNNFVMAFDVNDQGGIYDSADRPDGWWCAGKGGYTSWTPSVTTEAATGNLSSTPGKIVGGARFGYQAIAFKQQSMYIGTYVGQPQIWRFDLIPGEAGALSHEAIQSIGTPEEPMLIFMGFDNFYVFNGGRPQAIGNALKDTVFAELNYDYYYAVRSLVDQVGKLVYFFYPSGSSGNPDKCVVYHYLAKRWGRADMEIEAALQYVSAGISYDDLGTIYATYADLPERAYDLAFRTITAQNPAVVNTSHKVATLDGPTEQSSITTGDYGDDQGFTLVQRVRPKFLSAPQSASFINYYRNSLHESLTQGVETAMSNGRFDFLREARWHRGRFDMIGNHEIVGFSADVEQGGSE